jgi:hypothetical protein
MLDFLTAEGSPFHKVPHSIATFVFVLILLHVAAFCAWLVVFLRKTLSSEDERMKQFLQNREVRPFTHLIVIRVVLFSPSGYRFPVFVYSRSETWITQLFQIHTFESD